MPSEKRARQRQGREARRQQLLAAQRKRKAMRRGIAIGVIMLIVATIVGLATLNNDGGTEVDTASGATTTSAPGPTTTAKQEAVKIGTQECPAADGSSPKTTKFDGAFKQCIDNTKTYTAVVATDVGEFEIALDQKKAPNTVNNFVSLARYHAYDGVPFHRVLSGFMIQGGDVALQNGSGDAGYKFNDELPEKGEYEVGSVAMANSGANTNGSQFFVITGPEGVGLPPNYNLFGKVSSGMETVKKIEADAGSPESNGSPPKVTHTITSVTITES